MDLKEFNSNPTIRARSLGKFLKSQYGITISENTTVDELSLLKEKLHNDVRSIKERSFSSGLSEKVLRNLMIIESIDALLDKKLKENEPLHDKLLKSILEHTKFSLKHGYGGDESDVVQECIDTLKRLDLNIDYDKLNEEASAVAINLLEKDLAQLNEDEEDFGDDPYASVSPETQKAAAQALSKMKSRRSGAGKADPEQIRKRMSQQHKKYYGKKNSGISNMVTRMMGKKGKDKMKPKSLKENYLSEIRYLLENEVGEAEVIVSLGYLEKEVQDVVEKISKMQNTTAVGVIDHVRSTLGYEYGNHVGQEIESVFNALVDQLKSAREDLQDLTYRVSEVSGKTSAHKEREPMDMDSPADEIGGLGDEEEVDLDDYSVLPGEGPGDKEGGVEDEFAGDEAASGEMGPESRKKKPVRDTDDED